MYDYDAIPYETLPFSQTHPQQLALYGRFFGIDTIDPAQCRVLELGAATGGNLIPMAFYYPDSQFVGIELEASQVASGQDFIQQLGIDNIDLLQGDIRDVDLQQLGQFDYIIAHGVYSWIPDEVREALLRLYRNCLKPNGIGYISYNTRPGWQARGMVRDMLLFHVRDISDPVDRLNKSLEFIDVMHKTLSQQVTPLSRYLADEFRYLQTSHPSYIYHEFLEENNKSFLFREFVNQIESHGLRYLCETQLSSMLSSSYGNDAEAFLEAITDSMVQESYIDYFNLRTLRQSLVCHQDVVPDFDIDLAMISRLAAYSQLSPPQRLELKLTQSQQFTLGEKKTFPVSEPISKRILQILHQAYPQSLSIAEILQQLGHTASDQDSDWQNELLSLFISGAFMFSLSASPTYSANIEFPHAHALARGQAATGQALAGYWHEIIDSDPFSQRLIHYLDGSHNLEQLTGLMLEDVMAGVVQLPGISSDKVKPERLRAQLHSNLQRLIQLFARHGLLLNETRA